MRSKKCILTLTAVLLLTMWGCAGRETVTPASSPEGSPENEAAAYVEVKNLHNGDAKFFCGRVMTSVDGSLTSFDINGQNRKCYDVRTNWIDGLDEERLLVYGNGAKEVGIVRFDEKLDVVANEVVMRSENLLIDPTLTKQGGVYYMSVTEIAGNVNNADSSKENGEYILHYYSSKDLRQWDLMSDIVRERHNIEDVDISADAEYVYCVYEKEDLDKGRSAICLKVSHDRGRTWSEEMILLDSVADQEPAVFEKSGDGYRLYYSSDTASPGESYMGARAYYAEFDKAFHVIKKDQLLPAKTGKGVLLYDMVETGGKRYILYAGNYLTDCDLVIEHY